jgi:hypothetical protein
VIVLIGVVTRFGEPTDGFTVWVIGIVGRGIDNPGLGILVTTGDGTLNVVEGRTCRLGVVIRGFIITGLVGIIGLLAELVTTAGLVGIIGFDTGTGLITGLITGPIMRSDTGVAMVI